MCVCVELSTLSNMSEIFINKSLYLRSDYYLVHNMEALIEKVSFLAVRLDPCFKKLGKISVEEENIILIIL